MWMKRLGGPYELLFGWTLLCWRPTSNRPQTARPRPSSDETLRRLELLSLSLNCFAFASLSLSQIRTVAAGRELLFLLTTAAALAALLPPLLLFINGWCPVGPLAESHTSESRPSTIAPSSSRPAACSSDHFFCCTPLLQTAGRPVSVASKWTAVPRLLCNTQKGARRLRLRFHHWCCLVSGDWTGRRRPCCRHCRYWRHWQRRRLQRRSWQWEGTEKRQTDGHRGRHGGHQQRRRRGRRLGMRIKGAKGKREGGLWKDNTTMCRSKSETKG